jgi:hypothetical protein
MRTMLVVTMLIVTMSYAEARMVRVPITKPSPPSHFMAQNICTFVAWSVAPDWPQAQQKLYLGNCSPRWTPRLYS